MASERRRRRLFGALLIVVTGLAVPAVAHADPTPAEKESARNHMQQGDAFKDKGDKEAALKSYEAADAIMHVPTTGIEVARMQAALGLLLEARDTLARVAKLPAKPNEPPPFVAARKAATELAADVNARIPSLAVTVTNADPAQTITTTIDNETVTPGTDAKKLNPGKHVVAARAGTVEKREEITLAEREQKTVTLDLKPPPPSPPPEPPPSNAVAKPLIYGGFALAIVGVGVGSATGLMSIARVNDVKPQCEGGTRCPASTASDIDSAKTLGTVSTVAFIAGGVGVALGVTGLVMNKSRSDATTAKVEPMIGPTWAGVRGAF